MANGDTALVRQSYSRVSLLVLGMLAVLFATQALGQALDWNRDLYYEKGSVVFFLGSEFTAQSGNRNVEPTLSTEIWKKTGEVIATSRASRIPGWSPATLYDIPQLTVAHKGRIWRNISRTINEEPGKFGINVWQSIGLDFNTPPVFSVNEFLSSAMLFYIKVGFGRLPLISAARCQANPVLGYCWATPVGKAVMKTVSIMRSRTIAMPWGIPGIARVRIR